MALAEIEAMQAGHQRHVGELLEEIHALAGDMCGRLGQMTRDDDPPTRDDMQTIVDDLEALEALAKQLKRAIPAEQLTLDFK